MGLVYSDANALMRWAEGQCESSTSDQAAAATRVSEIINDPANTVAISETTFIEFHDNVLRYQGKNKVEWTAEWVKSVQSQLMEWIGAGTIQVQPHAARTIDVAMSYISMAREENRSLKAADAVHLACVIEWAHDTGETVTMVTGDRAFAKFLEVFPSAAQFVAIEEIVVTQDSDPGTDVV